MRYLGKASGLVALAMMGMLVVAGGAGASTLTQAPPYTGVVEAESEGAIIMDGGVYFECQKSALEWSVESHGSGAAVRGPLTVLTLEECGKDTVTVLNRGRFELHATSGGNGTMTWTNAEITVQLHHSVFGFPITTHCIYETSNTDIGTFTGSATTKATATLDSTFELPQVATDSACNSTELTSSYTFTSPDYLVVD